MHVVSLDRVERFIEPSLLLLRRDGDAHGYDLGRTKRSYALTDAGREVLDAWAESLTRSRKTIDRFLKRYAASA